MVPLGIHIPLPAHGLYSGTLLRPRASLAALARRGPEYSCSHRLPCIQYPLAPQHPQKEVSSRIIPRRPQVTGVPGLGYSHSCISSYSNSYGNSHCNSHSHGHTQSHGHGHQVLSRVSCRPCDFLTISSSSLRRPPFNAPESTSFIRCSTSANSLTAAASSSASAIAVTATPMTPGGTDMAQPRQLLSSQRYEAPHWAQELGPVPETRLALGHLPTPIHRWSIPGLPEGTTVLIKRDDLSGMELSGNKVRKLEFLLAQAVAEGADCVVTIGGIQSNHCRATTVAARYLGLDTHLILRTAKAAVESDPGLVGNLLVERMAGAHIHLVSKEEYGKYGSMALGEKLVQQLQAEGRKPFLIPVGGSNALGTWGYVEAIREIEAQVENGLAAGVPTIDHIAMACGSGGTTAGLALGSHLSSLKAKVHAYGVCDSPKYFYDFVQDLFEGLSASNLKAEDLFHVKDVKGQGYALSTEEELQLVKEVAEATGIVLDPVYSGKALKGMVDDMRLNPGEWEGKTVLFIHTGGLLGMYEKLSQLQPLFGKWNRMALP